MICTLISQPRGLTTKGDLIRKSFDIHSPPLFFSSAHFILRKACAWPDLPPLARGLNSGKPATQEMWIQEKKPPFQALRDPFSTNYSKCLRQASSPGASDGGSRAKAAGAPSLVFSEIFLILMFSLPYSPLGPLWKPEHETKYSLKNELSVTKSYNITAYVIILQIANIYGFLNHGKGICIL